MASPLPPRRAVPAPASRRWLAVLALSVLLHLLLIGWGSGQLRMPAPHAPTQPVLDAALLTPLPKPVPPAVPAAKPAPKKPQRPAPVQAPAKTMSTPEPPATAAPPPAPAAADAPAIEAAAAPDSDYSVPGGPLPPIPVVNVSVGGKGEGSAANPPPAEPVATPHYRVDPPPSAALSYDVEALREGQRVYGHGSIEWRTDGNSYTLTGDAGILFFSVLSFKSEGMLDDFGVAPVLYNEKRFRKSATNTHFQRERQLISFSASTTSYPRQGGEQDRASVIWQLAAIGRGDGSRFVAGADIDLFVAGVRDAETWRIHVVGQEVIDIGGRQMAAWHVLRAPLAGSYDQKIDIWLAPEQEWYPVKLRYTERNGDYLDLLLSNIKRPQLAGDAPPAAAENPVSSHEWIN